MQEQFYDNLLVELECPICTNYMSPPIRQCATGHSICEPCRKKLPKCALCQGKFTESRNLSLEGLAVKMHYPCINKNLGCPARLTYTQREIHELHCPLTGFKCAMEKCPWVGRIEEIPAHWASKKMTSKPYHRSNICHTKIKAESYYVNMVQTCNQIFWFKCKLIRNKIYWAVQLIGNAAESENYYYEIEIFKPGKPKKRILIGDYCQPIDLENSQLFNDDTCISVSTESVNSFLTVDQTLIYYMRVNQVKEEQDESAQNKSQAAANIPSAAITGNQKFKPRDHSKGPSGANKNQKKNQNQKKVQETGYVLL